MNLLQKHGLQMRIKKCQFMQPKIELLEHYIHKDGVCVDDVKVEKIRASYASKFMLATSKDSTNKR